MRFIGSKQLLLGSIESIIRENLDGDEKTFLDLFAGTNVVGNFFKKDFEIITNDILYFSYVNSRARIQNNCRLLFSDLRKIGINDPIEHLQHLKCDSDSTDDNYYELSYTPSGGAMYFTVENGKKIDAIRSTIEIWLEKSLITEDEYFYLLAVLIEAVPFVSNTTGTYGAFLKHWDKRSLKPIELLPIDVLDNKQSNKSFNLDSNELIRNIEVDIAYIDTPYNTRQYAPNYHVLENIAKNNKPTLSGLTKLFDWSPQKSKYSQKNKALSAMEDLIKQINSKHIVLSYNDEGIIPIDNIVKIMQKNSINNNVTMIKLDYRKYKSKIAPEKHKVQEYLLYMRKKNKTYPPKVHGKNQKVEIWAPKTSRPIKSPLNYIGGKYKLLDQILPLFPRNIDVFLDLFCGGANVGINVNANKHIFNDMNSRIIEMFRFFSISDPDEIVQKVKTKIINHGLSKTNEKSYISFRKMYNENPNPLDLYVLVSFSYNFQIRFNNSMEFNNPFGRNRSHFSENMEKNLREFIFRLNQMDVIFKDKLFTDFDYSILDTDDFVYLDPPYLITTGSYNDGNRGFTNWGVEQEKSMYDLLDYLSKKKIKWALSNVLEHKGNKNFILEEFINKQKVKVNYLDINYANSSHNTKKGNSIEVLITNY